MRTKNWMAASSLAIGALGLAAGCTMETAQEFDDSTGYGGAEVVDGVEQELIGGTITTARPEIGRLTRAGKGTCTATMISPFYIVTASHCLNQNDWQDVVIDPNDTFTVTWANGTQTQARLDRAWSFGSHRTEKIWNGRSSDLALIKLKTPIFGDTAPVPISPFFSESGSAWSTRFGYGCTSRETSEGSGVKRFRSFQGLVSNMICYGDSGGPTFLGNGINASPLYAINSGWNFDLSAGGVFDIVADAAYQKRHIEAVMASWDGAWSYEVDRPGGDYRSFAAGSTAICDSTCDGEAACQAWTYRYGTCFLKSAVPGISPLAGADSGVKDNRTSDYENHWDRPGADYNIFTVANDGACRTACVADYRCQAFTVGPGSGGVKTCWLKDEQPNPVAIGPAFKSGARRGTLANRYWSGTYFHSFSYAMPSPEICQSECAVRSNCAAWSYRGSAQVPTPRSPACYLYSSVGMSIPTTSNFVSGVKGKEFR